MLTLPLVIAAVSAGLAGGIHCVGMCGGISSLLGDADSERLGDEKSSGDSAQKKVIHIRVADTTPDASSQATVQSVAPVIPPLILRHAGRIFIYMLVGALFGSLGTAGMLFRPYLPVQQILFIVGNLALIYLGMRLSGWTDLVRALIPSSALFARLNSSVTNILSLAMRNASRYPFFTGMAWGCLPCGLLYGVAPFALLAGDARSGAMLMLIFGLSALPYLLLAPGLIRYAKISRYARYVRVVAASLLLAIGLSGLWYFDMSLMPDFLCITPR
ncbi:sulfite exporter TauE/SafE family protein [Undibacterium sp. RuTC16W]|uniref:sulfite exporter TauE/SafE family protein n=1 Tax=Undibacterium sp. RuTC16W TaxID=3413048 RepID=UPI003BF3A2BF